MPQINIDQVTIYDEVDLIPVTTLDNDTLHVTKGKKISKEDLITDLGIEGTNLTPTRNNTTVIIESSTGTPAEILAANVAFAGVMTADDKIKLDGIEANASADQSANDIKAALETLTGTNRLNASAIEGLPTGGTDDQTATEVSVTPTGNLTSTNVQTALEELQEDVDTLSANTTGELNVQSDWNEATNTEDSFILNKPNILNTVSGFTAANAAVQYVDLLNLSLGDGLSILQNGPNSAQINVRLLDEDNLISDSNTSIPTQQSVKAYVDANASSHTVVEIEPSSDDGSGATATITAESNTTYLIKRVGAGTESFVDIVFDDVNINIGDSLYVGNNHVRDINLFSQQASFSNLAEDNLFNTLTLVPTQVVRINRTTQGLEVYTVSLKTDVNAAGGFTAVTILSNSTFVPEPNTTYHVLHPSGATNTTPRTSNVDVSNLTVGDQFEIFLQDNYTLTLNSTGNTIDFQLQSASNSTQSNITLLAGSSYRLAYTEVDKFIVTQLEKALLDEDDLSSNSDTQAATQQSIKAYIDANSGETSYGFATLGLTTASPDLTPIPNTVYGVSFSQAGDAVTTNLAIDRTSLIAGDRFILSWDGFGAVEAVNITGTVSTFFSRADRSSSAASSMFLYQGESLEFIWTGTRFYVISIGTALLDEDDLASNSNQVGATQQSIKTYVDNTTATQAQGLKADTAIQPSDLSTVATTGEYADLINAPDLSSLDNVDTFANQAAFPATGNPEVFYIAQDTGNVFRWNGSVYSQLSGGITLGETSSTAYRGDRGAIAYSHSLLTSTNPHAVTKTDVGLGNVDNTSDLNKPISTATQTALNTKSDTGHTHISADITDFNTSVANNTAVAANSLKNSYPTADSDKLATIESGATADQSGTEITLALDLSLGTTNWRTNPTPNRINQQSFDLGFKIGAATIDVTNSNILMTLSGNVTSVAFTSPPISSVRTIVVLTVVQNSPGGYTIDWTGSGVIPPLGEGSADLQPNPAANSATQYWMYWNGTNFTITMLQLNTPL